jgi:alkanesulfonate monooxygenase SsuD/methylene tetrahydromethanopterin reductase-like flavin-dependent oxidoreductase (luciferase family)
LFNCAIAETDEEAWAKSAPFQRNIPSGRIREQALVGTPDAIRKRVQEIEQAGAQELIVFMPDSRNLTPLRMFAEACFGNA